MRVLIAALFVASLCMLFGCTQEPLVGGDMDEHGCVATAGYTWCEAKQKCLRDWEESCVEAEPSLSSEEALIIAGNSNCTDEGNLTGEPSFNTASSTWWIDMDTNKSGCSPACVVDEETGTAEINWRCLGAE